MLRHRVNEVFGFYDVGESNISEPSKGESHNGHVPTSKHEESVETSRTGSNPQPVHFLVNAQVPTVLQSVTQSADLG